MSVASGDEVNDSGIDFVNDADQQQDDITSYSQYDQRFARDPSGPINVFRLWRVF